MHTNYKGEKSMDYLKKSKKVFMNKLKKQNLKKNEWDIYAHENYLYSALTLETHYLTEDEWELNANRFELLKKKLMPKWWY